MDFERKYNAFISLYLHISFPEELPDDVWMEKVRQIQWLAKEGLLGLKGIQ